MTDPQVAIFMLSIFIFLVLLGFPIAFTLIPIGVGFGFIMITIGSQTTPAAVVGILMLTEAVFGPVWAWLFINEIPPISVIIGGSIIISAILFEFFFRPKKRK